MVHDFHYGVHVTHCCINHGCKYGCEDCPVSNDEVQQEYMCMDCEDDGIETMEQLKFNHKYQGTDILKLSKTFDDLSIHYLLEENPDNDDDEDNKWVVMHLCGEGYHLEHAKKYGHSKFYFLNGGLSSY